MAVQVSKSVSLTEASTGKSFKVSANNILNFLTFGSDTQISYVDNRSGKVITRLVTESLATINTAAARTQALTIDASSTTIYLNSDRIIFLDDLGSTTQISYDGAVNVPVIYVVSESVSSINTAAGNTFIITVQPSDATRGLSTTRYINNLRIDTITTEDVGSLPEITFTTKAKTGTGVIIDNGTSGITSATVTFSGGGAVTQATGHVTIAGGVITAFTIDTAGSGYTSYPTITVTVTGGSAGSTPSVTCSFTVESPMTIVDAGSNLNTAPTLTFSATTGTLATATATLDADAQNISGTTLTNAGAYKNGTDTYPTLAVSGGAGAHIIYDAKGTAFVELQVEETAADLQTTINAL